MLSEGEDRRERWEGTFALNRIIIKTALVKFFYVFLGLRIEMLSTE